MKAILATPAVIARRMFDSIFATDDLYDELRAQQRQARLRRAGATFGADPMYDAMMAQQARAQLLMIMGRTR